MKYALESNTLSHAKAGESSVCQRPLADSGSVVHLPQAVIAEIGYGLARLPALRRRDRLVARFQPHLDELPRRLRGSS